MKRSFVQRVWRKARSVAESTSRKIRHSLVARRESRTVRRLLRNESQAQKSVDHPCIAMGFAWHTEHIGGVRRHMEAICEYSQFPITAIPSHAASRDLDDPCRELYHSTLSFADLRGYSLFHSHVDPNFIGICEAAHTAGRPWIHTYHALYFSEDWQGTLLPWQIEINQALTHRACRADIKICVSTWMQQLLIDRYDIHSLYIPNGVSVEQCDRSSAERFQDEFQLRDFVLYANSTLDVKNPLAFVELAKRTPDLVFVMMGTGCEPASIALKYRRGLPGNLILLGPQPHSVTLDALAACSAFVMTSVREGLPTVLLEAMSFSKPVVVPRTDGFFDAVPTDREGVFFDLTDPDSLDEALRTAINRRFVPPARAHVLEHFDWPKVAGRIDDIYRSLLS